MSIDRADLTYSAGPACVHVLREELDALGLLQGRTELSGLQGRAVVKTKEP